MQRVALHSYTSNEVRVFSTDISTLILFSFIFQLALLIGLADTPRPTAKLAVSILKDMNINTIMLTGDSSGAAGAVMTAVGAQSFIASMKPEDKLKWITDHQVL